MSSPCLADIAYFLWTAMDYTRSNERKSGCANCTCEFQIHDNQNHRWIFNGMILNNDFIAALSCIFV